MKSLLVHDFALPPRSTNQPAPSPPTDPSTIQIQVLATGVHNLVRSRASGRHYTAQTAGLPFNAGVDGVGRASTGPQAGKLVYFNTLSSNQGSFSEIVNVPAAAVVELDENADPVQVAAYVNPAMASWMALRTRVDGLEPGFTIFIMGVTSASGRVGVHVARTLGAGRVIGVARNAARMAELGLDETIVLKEKVRDTDFSLVSEADVIIDFLYGEPTQWLFESLKTKKKVTWINLGSLAGQKMDLSGVALRSNNLTIRGAGPGAWSMADFARETEGMVKATQSLSKQPVKVVKFDDIEKAWSEQGDRMVLVP